MLKGNKGVTLVALVITIIVLLILAGVSISLVVGNNGVINQATSAADSVNKANVKSELEMAVQAVETDWSATKYTTGTTQTLDEYMTKSKIEENMDTDNYTISDVIFSGDPASADVTVTYKGQTYTYTISLTSSGNSAIVKEK